MAYNIGITPIGYYNPPLTNNNWVPKVSKDLGGGYSFQTQYSNFLAYTGISQSKYGLDVPIGLNVGFSGLNGIYLYKPLPNSGVSNPIPSYFSVKGRLGPYYICQGGGSGYTHDMWFTYNGSDPIGTYKTFTGLPTPAQTSTRYAVFGDSFYVWQPSSTYVYVYKLTITNGSVTVSNQRFSVNGSSSSEVLYIQMCSVLNDGKYLFSTFPSKGTGGFKFFVADPDTLTMTKDTVILDELTNSGFLYPSTAPTNYTFSHYVVASSGRRLWLVRTIQPKNGSTITSVIRMCMFDPNTLLSDSVLVPKILFWGEFSELEALTPPISGMYKYLLFVPTLIGTVYLIIRGSENDTSWGITELYLGPTDPAPPEPSDDPYQEEGGISDYGGGGGGVDMDTSDNVDFPTIPQNLISDCGLVSFYNPTKSEITQLADQILSQSIGGAIKNFFTDPLDGIVSLSLANVTPPLSGTRGEIKVGLIGTGVTANLLSSSYMELDCGTIQVGDKTKGNALDFTPYTKAELYLPFIGTVSVSPDDFMYSSVNIKYNIDLMSGTCVANVRIAKDGKNDILYSLDGNVLSQVPLSGKSYAELIKALASIGTALALGGSSGAAVAGVAGATLTNSKPAIARSGRMSLATGALSPKKPYLIFSRPKQSLPEKFKSYKGYPSNVTTKLSEIIGFTQVKEIHLEGIAATSEELTMIEDLLKEGVII